jgi:hypothetical protein
VPESFTQRNIRLVFNALITLWITVTIVWFLIEYVRVDWAVARRAVGF